MTEHFRYTLACNNGAPLEVIQLLLDRFVGDERHHNGLNVADSLGRLPIHWYVHSQGNARPDTLQYLLDLNPAGIHVADRYGMLPLHHACDSKPPVLEIIRLLVEAAPHTVIQKSAKKITPLRYTRRRDRRGRPRRNVEVETYLIDRQNEAVDAMKEAFADVANTQLGLPDLVISNVWSFAKPDV